MSGSSPSNNPVVQQLQVLLYGTGFNFYNAKNQARADDLLVRQKASALLGEAAQGLTILETEFSRSYVPPSTHEHPFPPAEAMDRLRQIGQLRGKLHGLEAQINGMAVPTQDHVWWRFREETDLLGKLLEHDLSLVQQADTVRQQLGALSASDWNERTDTNDLDALLHALENSLRSRQQLLSVPV